MAQSENKAGEEHGARRRGQKLHRLRRMFAPEKKLLDLAYSAGVHEKTIRDKWERQGVRPDWVPFWAYLKILEKEAGERIDVFVQLRDEIVELFFPELPKQRPGDARTPEEYQQDLADYVHAQEIDRSTRLREVEAIVERLLAKHAPSDPKPILPSQEIHTGDALPDRAFDITLVFPIEQRTISIHRRGSGTWRSPYLLSIDLRDQRYGIHSGAGKGLLLKAFVDGARGERLYKAAEQIDAFMMEITEERGDLWWKELVDGDLAPLRHASAGILPIAHRLRPNARGGWEDDGDWIVLFVRDIPPAGLNVGNGASEGPSERRDLEKLISREFAEELVLLKERPVPGKTIEQLVFYDSGGGNVLTDSDTFRRFSEAHVGLRQRHDHFTIHIGGERRFLEPLHTPFAVRVMDADGHSRCGNVVFSVNPPELGIEVIRPYRFNLHEGEWLIDGEILPSSQSQYPRLVRRPIILIRLEFLREYFRKHGGLGERIEDRMFLGGKRIGYIPPNAVRVFAEIDLRESRLKEIESGLSSATIDDAEKRALNRESQQIQTWFATYGRIIGDALDGNGLKGDLATTLCPVTYRTLEAAFQHHVAGF